MARASAPTNPFQYGALALDQAFTDREREIAELSAVVRNGQDVVVFAPRRYGKSSLIWRVVQRLVKRGVLVGQIDLMSTPTREKFAERLAKTIHDEMASRLFKAKERLAVFSGLRVTPTITVYPDDGSISFSFDARAARADIDATLEELFALPGRIGADRGRRAALVFDEFQEVVEIDPGLPKLMRSAFQEQPEVAHVYLGSKRHMMERIFNDANEPFWRSAKQLELWCGRSSSPVAVAASTRSPSRSWPNGSDGVSRADLWLSLGGSRSRMAPAVPTEISCTLPTRRRLARRSSTECSRTCCIGAT